ncbi:DUF3775 domain-containing protein [Thermopetrobacter sp. TC1]|uniref:DUF3775 domain-containing protein n=1 Tax=Thermopetrobacter sp. TC1 TaxID=1495045 RepID=UPI0006911088|nr:DUF3775 domain-containing protein [Thermopetrobacter sp. TC1]
MMVMTEITPDKVAQVIVRAREIDARVGAWDEVDRTHPDEGSAEAVLEALRNDPSRMALVSFLNEMRPEELAELVALMWIGRGSFEPEEWREAVDTALEDYALPGTCARYLLREPLLADYLEEGLERMGYSIEDAERDVT